MPRLPALALLALALLALAGEASAYSLEELREDYDFLVGSALALNPLVNADRASLEAFAAERRARLTEGMGLLDFYRVAAPFVAKIGCGHTSLSLPGEAEARILQAGRFLPFAARVVGGRIFAGGGSSIPAGSEILAIDSLGSGRILASIAEGMSADGTNLTMKYNAMDRRFNELYYLFLGSAPAFAIEYSRGGGEAERVELPSIPKIELSRLMREAGLPPPKPESTLSFAAKDAAVLKIASFDYYEPASLERFKAVLDSFFATMSERGIGNLVLDLRGNGGGDPAASSHLLRYLISEPVPYFSECSEGYKALKLPLGPAERAFKGRLVTLIDGASFSSTGHLCALLKHHGIGAFVGEESGGSFSCTDASRSLTLPRTKLAFTCSTREYVAAVSGMRRGRGVMPDIEAVPTIRELLDGRDIPMETAMRIIAEGK